MAVSLVASLTPIFKSQKGFIGSLVVPSQSAGGRLNCAASPSACGYPDATNTGVRAGVALKSIPSEVKSGPGWHWDPRGWITIDGDGATFSGYDVKDPIEVTASNVTVSNVRVTVGGEAFGIGLKRSNNVTIQDTEITAPGAGANRLLVGIKDVYGDANGTVIQRTDISRTSTGIQTHEGLIQDNYIHDLGFKEGDHTNGTTSNGSTKPLSLIHNTVFNPHNQTDAISLFQDFGVEANRVIDNNLLAGGGYTIYAGQNAGAPDAYNIKVTNNRISRIYYPNGGSYGPASAYNPTASGNVWSGNIWDDTGAVIPAT